ncbi:MAG: hypothetical protein M3N41_07900, partial [Acidobacteriota bacterium]|nr:hypothetical protein [Acidobacteriota bacterium]
MTSKNLRTTSLFLLIAAFSALAQDHPDSNLVPQSPEKNTSTPPILWQDPTDLASRDLRFGQGGEDHAPQGTVFEFVKEDLSGTNPKLIVTDRAGHKWKIKLGAEAQPEVAASRLVWSVGYFTNENYFVPQLQITGLPAHLHRGKQFILPGGEVRNARLQRMDKSESKEGNWEWKQDPFSGTRELNGLRVLMAVINNWDLKDVNNKIVLEKAGGVPREIYYVSDLGGSFGPPGIVLGLSKSRGNLAAYRSSRFIVKLTPQAVNFATPRRAALIELFNPPQYVMRLHLRWIGRNIPRGDAKWMAGLLARLSPGQIRDAFRAAGYSTQQVEG